MHRQLQTCVCGGVLFVGGEKRRQGGQDQGESGPSFHQGLDLRLSAKVFALPKTRGNGVEDFITAADRLWNPAGNPAIKMITAVNQNLCLPVAVY